MHVGVWSICMWGCACRGCGSLYEAVPMSLGSGRSGGRGEEGSGEGSGHAELMRILSQDGHRREREEEEEEEEEEEDEDGGKWHSHLFVLETECGVAKYRDKLYHIFHIHGRNIASVLLNHFMYMYVMTAAHMYSHVYTCTYISCACSCCSASSWWRHCPGKPHRSDPGCPQRQP